jgi:hypothetical protein
MNHRKCIKLIIDETYQKYTKIPHVVNTNIILHEVLNVEILNEQINQFDNDPRCITFVCSYCEYFTADELPNVFSKIYYWGGVPQDTARHIFHKLVLPGITDKDFAEFYKCASDNNFIEFDFVSNEVLLYEIH